MGDAYCIPQYCARCSIDQSDCLLRVVVCNICCVLVNKGHCWRTHTLFNTTTLHNSRFTTIMEEAGDTQAAAPSIEDQQAPRRPRIQFGVQAPQPIEEESSELKEQREKHRQRHEATQCVHWHATVPQGRALQDRVCGPRKALVPHAARSAQGALYQAAQRLCNRQHRPL